MPTQRAAAALGRALFEASKQSAILLPRIAPLGVLEPGEDQAFASEAGAPPREALVAAVKPLARRHVLARFVRKWGEALRGAIRAADANGLVFDPAAPALVATTPAEAYALANDLAALIDDLIIEGVDPAAIEAIEVGAAHDEYWRITLDFLKIAFANWPLWLTEQGLVDRAQRVKAEVEREIAALQRPDATRGPTIVAGSTGANAAVAKLIAAVAQAERGAVVLPGLDQDLDDRAFAMAGAGEDDDGAPGHAQALLHRLIRLIGVERKEVIALGAPTDALRARAALTSEALRPAASTDLWAERKAALAPGAVTHALGGVAVIVAETETEEALALAVAMRETLTDAGKTAALVTPDRSIARRVAAELARWGVTVEDLGGRPLGETEAGALARLTLDAAADFRPLAVQALIAHPAARFGRTQARKAAAARALEIGVFRAGPVGSLEDLDRALAEAARAADDAHAHPALRAIRAEGRAEAESLARDCAAALKALQARSAPLGRWLDAHRAALAAVIAAPEGERVGPFGLAALETLLDEWRAAAGEDFFCTLAEYQRLFEAALAEARAPLRAGGHPRLAILGLLEARLLHFDRMLIAGLDEKVWPPAVDTDAFLNRSMRASLRLSPPERRVGQTAHDFVAAFCAGEAILSRAKKRGGEPTVASRLLQRLAAAAGGEAFAAAEQRGAATLALARALDEPKEVKPCKAPRPTPPAAKRPRRLSVTRIETLRRDPYAIYADRILKLKALAPVEQALGVREAGDAWHKALEDFGRTYPTGPLPPEARARLLEFARLHFAAFLEDPGFVGLNWPNIEETVDFVIGFENEARAGLDRIFVELRARSTSSFAMGCRSTSRPAPTGST